MYLKKRQRSNSVNFLSRKFNKAKNMKHPQFFSVSPHLSITRLKLSISYKILLKIPLSFKEVCQIYHRVDKKLL